MVDGSRPCHALRPLLHYLLGFHAAWGLWLLAIFPVTQRLGDTTFLYAVVNIGLRMLVWVLPVFLYIRYIDRTDPIDFLKLSDGWKRGVVIGLALTAINFGSR